ncbi:MAG: phosphoribosyltransferase family protein [Planctomycetota bacterium]
MCAQAQFVWPPRSLPDGDDEPRTREPNEAPAADDVWTRFERTWLSPVAEPLSRRIADGLWAPDAPDAFCDICGSDVGPYEASEFGCAACCARRLPWSRFVRLGRYAPPLERWVQEVKFGAFHALGRDFGRLLGCALREAGVLESLGAAPVIVPLPTSVRRRMVRRIDHAGVIAQGVARELGASLVRALRRGHRPSQRAVAPSERAANVRGAFRARGVGGGRSAVLVDDVTTSGATLRAAARELRRAGWGELWVACVAVTPAPERPGAGRAGRDGGPQFIHNVDLEKPTA